MSQDAVLRVSETPSVCIGRREAALSRVGSLAVPGSIFLALFFLAPLCYLLALSLHPGGSMGRVGPEWSLVNYQRFLTDTYYLGILWDTGLFGASTALICAVLAFPFSYKLARMRGPWRTPLLFITVLPLLISAVIRNLGWIPVLSERGVLNLILQAAGLRAEPVEWIYNYTGALIGMVHVELPFMVLMLMAVIRKIDPALEEAAINLGAAPWQVFLKVILPLSRPGLVAGTLMVFMASISALVTPAILGGKRVMLMALYIDQQMRGLLNYPVGATAAILTMVAASVAMLLALKLGRSRV